MVDRLWHKTCSQIAAKSGQPDALLLLAASGVASGVASGLVAVQLSSADSSGGRMATRGAMHEQAPTLTVIDQRWRLGTQSQTPQ